MTTFIRSYFPFTVQASVDSTTPDFKVSTNGALELNTPVAVSALTATLINATDLSVATTAAAGAYKVVASISATVSVPVTAAAVFTVFDDAGTPWRVAAYTTLAAVG